MHLQSLPSELLKWTTHHLNPREYMRLHRTCKLMYSNRKPYNFQIPTEHLHLFLRKAPLEVLESIQIAEWTEEAIVTAFVRGLPQCHALIRNGQLSDRWYTLRSEDAHHRMSKYTVTEYGDSKETLLIICAMFGHTSLIHRLLDNGFENYEDNSEGLTPLGCAIVACQPNACRVLIQRGARMDYVALSSPAMHTAAEYSTPEIMEILLNAGQDVNLIDEEESPLHRAAESGTVKNVQWLMEHGADLWRRGYRQRTTLDYSQDNSDSTVFDYLLQLYLKSDPPEYWKEDALTFAALAGNSGAFQKLLDLGASVNGNPNTSETPLSQNLSTRSPEVFQQDIFDLLMEHGAGLYVGDASKESPLINAAESNLTGVMEQLIKRDPRIVQWACREGHFGALHAAAQNDRVEACQVLLKHGVQINVKDEYGRTPLMLSTEYSSHQAAALLIESGADLQIGDNDGWSVMEHAIESRSNKSIHLLRERGMQLPANIPDGAMDHELVGGANLMDW
ncbi:ankyrin repeat-containing domain protein [Gorgonomyces haynaldii]|nr:ankyrin repeat-containing domain protein [Gorgonomyces haynaldii]